MSENVPVSDGMAKLLALTVGWARTHCIEMEHACEEAGLPADRDLYAEGLKRRYKSEAAVWDELCDLMEVVAALRTGDRDLALAYLAPWITSVAEQIGIEEVVTD